MHAESVLLLGCPCEKHSKKVHVHAAKNFGFAVSIFAVPFLSCSCALGHIQNLKPHSFEQFAQPLIAHSCVWVASCKARRGAFAILLSCFVFDLSQRLAWGVDM